MQERLEIYALGGLRIQRAGIRVSGFVSRKAEALLVYLARSKQAQSREILGELFSLDSTKGKTRRLAI